MERLFLLMAGAIALGVYFLTAPVAIRTYRRYRKPKTVICPDTGAIAEVDIRAVRAALTSAFGKHWLRVRWCSQWPHKRGCAEECVKQVSPS